MTLNSIINSPFQLGAYVKQVMLEDPLAPHPAAIINPANDRLYQLTKNVPRVEVSIIPIPKIRNWLYFSTTLLDNDNWKLHKLPTIDGYSLNAPFYFFCARHVRDSKRGMIGIGDFVLLGDFDQLRPLILEEMY